MANVNDTDKEQLNQEAGEGMKTYTFKIKIAMPQYAKKFGIDLPDDSADEIYEGDGDDVNGHEDGNGGIPTEDADVSYGTGMKTVHSSLYGQCEATLAQCKAKNPMTCRYHGAKAISQDIEAQIRAAGVQGDVSCQLDDIVGNTLSLTVTVKASAADEAKVQAAMKQFLSQPGVSGDEQDFEYDKGTNDIYGGLDIDMLDPGAVAKWGAGQQPQQQQNQQQQTTAQQQSASTSSSQQTPPPAAKRTRTRKRTKPADETKTKSEESPAEPKVEEEPKKEERNEDFSAGNAGGEEYAFLDDENAPELYPNEKPKEPPKWEPPYSQQELDILSAYAKRIGKTAERIDEQLPDKMAEYLQKGNGDPNKPYSNLPKGLQRWKNDVDCEKLRALADKDTDGQVRKMLETAEKINASESNGWMDKIGVKRDDVQFDPLKYVDPYAKERLEYSSYKEGGAGREEDLKSLKSIESSTQKDAPKDEFKQCKDIANTLSELEEDYATAKANNAPNDVLKMFGRAYYATTEKFKNALGKCKEWLSKQYVMKSTVSDTADYLRQMGLNVPTALTHKWDDIELQHEDASWRYVARRLGLATADKEKHMDFFKPNMRSFLTRCPIQCCYNHNHIKNQCFHSGRGDIGRINGNNNTYVDTHNAAFGTSYYRESHESASQIMAYGIVASKPLSTVSTSVHYMQRGGDVAILLNPKKAIIGYCNHYLDSRYPITSHNRGCNITFANNPTCTGVALGKYDGHSSYNTCGQITKNAFEEDFSKDPWEQVVKKIGLGDKTGEAYAVGGCNFDEGHALALRDFFDHFTPEDIKKFNDKGITVLNSMGKLVGENKIPDDPDLQALVWGTGKKPRIA